LPTAGLRRYRIVAPKKRLKTLQKNDESTKYPENSIPPTLPASPPFTYLIRQHQAQKALFYNMTTGLVQQTVQITASRDLTLFVGRSRYAADEPRESLFGHN